MGDWIVRRNRGGRIDAALNSLDEIAQQYMGEDPGLPLNDPSAKARMREILFELVEEFT